MQNLFKEVHHIYYPVKSYQNTRIIVSSNFIALLSLYMSTGLQKVQQTLGVFLKISFAPLSC